jgi:hypothetical protein
VAACREALKERTREHVPRPWAMTKNNLNTVSCSVGSAPENLKKCERTRERVLLDWASWRSERKAAPVSKGFGGARGMLRNSRISHANLDVAISTA